MAAPRNAFDVVNRQTGEVVEAYGLIIPTKIKHPYRESGIQVSQTYLMALASNNDLTKRALRIALWLLANINGPLAHFRHRDIVDGLAMHKSDVSKGLKELRQIGHFLMPPALGIRVRPSVAWKGKIADLITAMKAEKDADWEARQATRKPAGAAQSTLA